MPMDRFIAVFPRIIIITIILRFIYLMYLGVLPAYMSA